MQVRVAAQGQVVLDQNWRGAYDILVTPTDEDFGGAQTDGLVDGNFVATGGSQSISMRQLDEIRAVGGVQVAAPIGMVGVLRDLVPAPDLSITDDPSTGAVKPLPAQPTLFRISSSVVQTTDLGPRVLAAASGTVALRRLTAGDVAAMQNAQTPPEGVPGMADPTSFSPWASNLGFNINVGAIPAFASEVIAVDPVAEAALLGPGGDFLAPLAAAPKARHAQQFAAGGLDAVIASPKFFAQKMNIQDAASDPAHQSQPVVPLLVNTSPAGKISVDIRIEKSSTPLTRIPQGSDQLQQAAAAARFEPWRTVSKDISDVTVPFSSPDLILDWPGSTRPAGEGQDLYSAPATDLRPALIGRPDYQPKAGIGVMGSGPSYQVVPKGIVGADGLPVGPSAQNEWGNLTAAGRTQAYRVLTETAGSGFTTALPAPVGQFTSADLDFGFNPTSYVPLGAYDPARTILMTGPDGKPVAGQPPVMPSLSGVGFITGQPGAITDLAGGQELRGSAPIDAIRVRVSGISGYDPAAVDRVNRVARQIAALGLRATVVAGSSPRPVSVYVPRFDVQSNGSQTDLGWVRQDWTSLGAASAVSSAMDLVQLWLIVLGLLAAAAGVIAAHAVAGTGRRREVAVLRSVGWTEVQVRRRVAADQLPGLLLVLAAAVFCALTVHGRLPAVTTAGVAGAGGAVLATGLALWWGAHNAMAPTWAGRRHRPGRGVSGVWALARRRLAAAPGIAGLQTAGVAILGIAAAGIVAATITARRSAGATRLAGLAVDRTALATIALGMAGLIAGLILAVVARQADRPRRQEASMVFIEVGFSRGLTWRIGGAEVALTCLAALVVAVGAAAVLAGFGRTGAWPAVAAAVAVLLAAAQSLLRAGRSA